MKNKLEQAYDDLSYTAKEFAGMPTRFYELDSSVVSLLEDLVEALGEPDQSDNVEDINIVKDLLGEVSEALNGVLLRMGDNNGQG